MVINGQTRKISKNESTTKESTTTESTTTEPTTTEPTTTEPTTKESTTTEPTTTEPTTTDQPQQSRPQQSQPQQSRPQQSRPQQSQPQQSQPQQSRPQQSQPQQSRPQQSQPQQSRPQQSQPQQSRPQQSQPQQSQPQQSQPQQSRPQQSQPQQSRPQQSQPQQSRPQQSQPQQSQPQQSRPQQSQPQQSQPQQSQAQQSQPQQSQPQQSQPQQSQAQQSQPQQSQPQQSQPQQSQPQQSQPQQSQPEESQPEERGCKCHASKEDCVLSGNFELYMNGSFPEDKSRIRFKHLPFQRVIREVIPPMAIDFGKIMELAGPKNVRNHVSVKFFLSLSDFGRINLSNIASYDKKQSFQLQFRIGEKLSGINEFSEILPEPLEIWINSKKILMRDRHSPIHISVMDYLHLNTINANIVTILWPQCSKVYFLIAYLVEVINVEEMVEEIKTNNDRYFSALSTKQKITEFMKNSNTGLDLAAYKLTLLCPINKSKMELPAKSVKCNHLQCFDLEAYISLNRIKDTWICPICKKSCLLADLKIDSFILFIINSLNVPKHCEEIELYANGKWKPCISYGDSLEDVQTTSCGPSKKRILEIDLGNSDDENLDNNVKIVLPIKSAGNSNNIKPENYINTTTHTEQKKVDDTPIFTYIESLTIVRIKPLEPNKVETCQSLPQSQ
ncbi:E3 SUMO-protein ligase gei-17-like [Rhopalosiphum maidis]|uniref:E3 SUMO-protein ligase gei-17-like n=1 Tax=Rhopalosiphum maidis TaxID=43146 RepID=UPI000F0041F1|nr:E3 SUMO-protein ligase gei-17-like [Rhopalosiphum maidis]